MTRERRAWMSEKLTWIEKKQHEPPLLHYRCVLLAHAPNEFIPLGQRRYAADRTTRRLRCCLFCFSANRTSKPLANFRVTRPTQALIASGVPTAGIRSTRQRRMTPSASVRIVVETCGTKRSSSRKSRSFGRRLLANVAFMVGF